MLRRKLKPLLIIVWSTFLFMPFFAFANEESDYHLNTTLLKESVKLAIENLELIPNTEKQNITNYYQDILSSIHLSTSVITDNKIMDPTFYGIGTFFIAKHFGKLTLAKKILVEERRFASDILMKSWMEGELLQIEKMKYTKELLRSVPKSTFQNRTLQNDSFDALERINHKVNSVLYSEKLVHDEFKWILQASEILRNEAEQLASEGNLQGSILKIDLVASLLTSHPISTPNKIGPRIIAARTISDLGQLFQALVRYKRLLISTDPESNKIWHAIIYEDIGDLYLQMNLFIKAKEAYTNAISIANTENDSHLRLNKKLNLLRN